MITKMLSEIRRIQWQDADGNMVGWIKREGDERDGKPMLVGSLPRNGQYRQTIIYCDGEVKSHTVEYKNRKPSDKRDFVSVEKVTS